MERIIEHWELRLRRQHRRRLLLSAMALLATLLMGWQQLRAQSLPTDEPRPERAGAGQLLLRTEQGHYQRALQLEASLQLAVAGMLVQGDLRQRFRNDGDAWLQGTYVFPLPANAAVTAFRIRIGERIIEGRIEEREQARRIFEQARDQGKRAGLVSQERPNLFTTDVTNIGPGETVEVELHYAHLADYDHGRFSLRFPMTVTPRYMPGLPLAPEQVSVQGSGWASNTDQVADASRISPLLEPRPLARINPIQIEINLDAGLPLAAVESPSHRLNVAREERGARMTLAEGLVSMDRDFVLHWQPQMGAAPSAALFRERLVDADYSVLMLLPPDPEQAPPPLAREVLLIIDVSGSMQGQPIRQAKASVDIALSRLRAGDRFNIIAFNNSAWRLFPGSLEVSADNIARAQQAVARLRADGGTEMREALAMALEQPLPSGQLGQVIFVTDGAVGNEQALFGLIEQGLDQRRLFTVGIGAAPNSYFMREAARFGRGSFTHIADLGEVSAAMDGLFSKLDAPQVTDLRIDWPGATPELFPRRLPDLYRGEPLLVFTRGEAFSGALTVHGNTGDGPWQWQSAVTGAPAHQGLSKLWAREKIRHLLDGRHRGESEQAVREAVLPVALQHQLVSPYTSFVAVDTTPARPANADLDVANLPLAPPHGQAPQAYAFPNTDAGLYLRWIWTLAALLMAWVLARALRVEEVNHVAA